MPKRCVLPENDVRDTFIVLYESNDTKYQQEYVGLKNAVTGYRYLRSIYGDRCRMTRVILNYGVEI